MYELLFLGLIPGTHLQVTFSVWLCLAGLIAAVLLSRHAVRSRMWRLPYQHGKFTLPVRRQTVRS